MSLLFKHLKTTYFLLDNVRRLVYVAMAPTTPAATTYLQVLLLAICPGRYYL